MRLDAVDISNEAIGLVGSTDFIQSLTDVESENARRCNRYFLSSVEEVLRLHPSGWNCAQAFVELAENTSAPDAPDYDNAYALPFDCVKVVDVGDGNYSPYDRWRISGRNIYTDLEKVYLRYTAMPEDYRSLDILLAGCIAHRMALKMAPAYNRNAEVIATIYRAYKGVMAEAMAMDTLENKEAFTENSRWEDARLRA